MHLALGEAHGAPVMDNRSESQHRPLMEAFRAIGKVTCMHLDSLTHRLPDLSTSRESGKGTSEAAKNPGNVTSELGWLDSQFGNERLGWQGAAGNYSGRRKGLSRDGAELTWTRIP